MTKKLGLLAACLCLFVGLAFAAKIKSDFDKAADFSSYKTYAWGTNLEPARGPAAGAMIAAMIDAEMKARGLELTDVEHADLIIRYQAAGDTDMNFSSGDPLYSVVGGVPVPGTSFWSSGVTGSSSGRYIRKGALVVDVFDRAQHKLIWTSMATDTMKQGSPEKVVKQVGNIIQQMFKDYPAKAPPMEKS